MSRLLCALAAMFAALAVTAGAAAAADTFGNPIGDIACPSPQLCVAVDSVGNVVTSTNPAGGAGAWKAATIDAPHGLVSVSCAAPQFCLAADDAGDLLASQDPAGGARTWTRTHTGLNGTAGPDVACPSAQFCLAIDAVGDAFSSTEPARAGAHWRRVRITTGGLSALACPSAQLCVAVGLDGSALTSTDPQASAPVWTAATIDSGHALDDVACPAPTLCIAGEDDGAIVVSTNPSGGAAAWTRTQLGPPTVPGHGDVAGHFFPFNEVACASPALCVALGSSSPWVSTDPAGGAAAWTRTAGIDTFDGVACASPQLCVATDWGRRWVSTDPTGPAGAWSVALVDVLRPDAFAFIDPKTFVGQGVALAVRLPYSGVLTARDAGRHRPLIRRLRIAATGTGDVTLKLRPTARGRRILDRRHRLVVRVRVTYAPAGARATSQTTTVTLRSSRAGQSN